MSGPFAGSTAALLALPDGRRDIPRTPPTLTLPRRNGIVCYFGCQDRLCCNKEWVTRNSWLVCLVREGNVQAGGKDYVVFLRAEGRIGDIDVSKLVLPAQPFVDFRHGSGAEREAVFSGMLQIRKESCGLGQDCALSQFHVKFIADGGGDESVGYAIRGIDRRTCRCARN